MKNKRVLSVLLSIVMCLTLAGVMPPAAAHAESKSTTATRGVYWFDTHELGQDLTDTYIYDDALLTGDSKAYNAQLATMTYELAIASISSEREPKTDAGYANKSRNLRTYLEDNGFVDFDTNQYYKEKMTYKTMGAACAHKQIKDGGKTYTLLAIVPRSAGYESEWGGNFVTDESGDHAGFLNGRNIVLDFAKEYVAKYGIKGDIKVWTAGYSRGAGVDNQIGAALINDPKGFLGDSISLAPKDLYCYTFGTPGTASTANEPDDAKYDYIHNVYQEYDVVTNLPPADFGLSRYGRHFTYDSDDVKARMLKFLENTNSTVYNMYTTNADPAGFTPLKVQIGSGIGSPFSFSLVEDEESYLTDSQDVYLAELGETIAKVTEKAPDAGGDSRKGYAAVYQEPLRDLCAYYFSHTEKTTELVAGLKDSKTAIPMALSMYVMFMTEKTAGNWSDNVNNAIETAFNVLAGELENEDGSIKEEYSTAYPEAVQAYENVKNTYFNRLEEPVIIEVDGQEVVKHYELNEQFRIDFTNGTIMNYIKSLCSRMYAATLGDALKNAEADEDVITALTDEAASSAMSYILTYVLLYNKNQSTAVRPFSFNNEQFKQLATFVGNASRYMRPHNNEIILSWLRVLDPSYDNMENEKENDAQTAGYRRVFITAQGGAKVSGTVKDGSGKQIAAFENGKLLSSTDPWVAITTCDTGGWLRLPVDQTYRVVLKTDTDTKLNLRVAEFDFYDGVETREVEKDSNYNWKGLAVTPYDTVTLVVSKSGLVSKQGYPEVETMAYKSMDGKAKYYIEMDKFTLAAPTIHTIADAPKKAMDASWEKVEGADGYKISWRVAGKKWTTKTTTKLKYRIKNLKKGKLYEFKVAATKKATANTAALTGPWSEPMYRWYKTMSAKAKGAKKSANVTWKKVKGASGYIVLVSTSKNMKSPSQYVVKGGSKKKYKVKRLKSGKTYYVMVRPYKKKGGHRYDGITTTARKVKVK